MAFRFGKSLQINLTRSSLASHARSLLNHRPISVARQTAAFHDVAYWLPVPSASSSSSSTPHSSFSSSAKASRDDTTTTVAVVSELDNPALAQLPQLEGVDFLVGDTPEAFLKHDSKMATCEAYIFVAPMKSTESQSTVRQPATTNQLEEDS